MNCNICGHLITRQNATYVWRHVRSTDDLDHRAEPDTQIASPLEDEDEIGRTQLDEEINGTIDFPDLSIPDPDPAPSSDTSDTGFSFGGSDDGFSGGGGGSDW